MSRPSAPVWRVVAEREISTRIRDKTFIGASAVTLVFLIGFLVLTAVLGGGNDEYDVAVVGAPESRIVAAAQDTLRASGRDEAVIEATTVADTAAAERLVRDGDADAALLPTGDGFEIVGDDGVSTRLGAALTQAVSSTVIGQNAAEQDVDLSALNQGAGIQERLLDPNADEGDARTAVAFAFSIIFLLTALGFGMTIAQSVVQEKESRVVEILAAAVPIRSMLWGKIIGNTVLALGQVLLLVVVGVIGLVLTGRDDLLAGVGPAIIWYVAFFVLGFVALAALWSVAGSLASRQEDLQSTTLPGQLILMVPYFISVLASDQIKEWVSMLPIVATMVMPGRMAQGDVPGWQVAVGIVATLAAAAVFVRIGSRVYERTLLRTGGRVSYREALRTGV